MQRQLQPVPVGECKLPFVQGSLQDQDGPGNPGLAQANPFLHPGHCQAVCGLEGGPDLQHPVPVAVGLDDRPNSALGGMATDDEEVMPQGGMIDQGPRITLLAPEPLR